MSSEHHHGHQHHHHIAGAEKGSAAERALWLALWLNLAFLLIEVGAGLWANSLALLSDAGHMVSDVAALGLALMAERLARVQPGGAYTFGLKRVPVLGAFGNALALFVIVILIFHHAVARLSEPVQVGGWSVLVVGLAGLAVNLISAWKLHASGDKGLNVRGAILHMAADALGSVGAVVTAIVILTTGWTPIDSIMSIFIGLLILIGTWPLLRDATRVLLQAAPADVNVRRIRELITENKDVEQLIDLHVWEINSGQVVLSATLVSGCRPLSELTRVSDSLRKMVREEFNVDHATFEWVTPEAAEAGCEAPSCELDRHKHKPTD
jgi:cobalt-zinc-cadmium efflux system protein